MPTEWCPPHCAHIFDPFHRLGRCLKANTGRASTNQTHPRGKRASGARSTRATTLKSSWIGVSSTFRTLIKFTASFLRAPKKASRSHSNLQSFKHRKHGYVTSVTLLPCRCTFMIYVLQPPDLQRILRTQALQVIHYILPMHPSRVR